MGASKLHSFKTSTSKGWHSAPGKKSEELNYNLLSIIRSHNTFLDNSVKFSCFYIVPNHNNSNLKEAG